MIKVWNRRNQEAALEAARRRVAAEQNAARQRLLALAATIRPTRTGTRTVPRS